MEDEIPAVPSRRRLWFAVALTVAAVPVLIIENRSDGATDPDPRPVASVATVVVPVDRPAFGPPKGVSVVTLPPSPSTLPITTIPRDES